MIPIAAAMARASQYADGFRHHAQPSVSITARHSSAIVGIAPASRRTLRAHEAVIDVQTYFEAEHV